MDVNCLSFRLFYRFRVLLLFIVCSLVVGWATSYYLWEFQKTKIVMEHFRKRIVAEQEKKTSAFMEAPAENSDLRVCPALSPYLKGSRNLSFKMSLTLEEVEKSNPKVLKGHYRPSKCRPLQRVAILIPHRNREKHLLYLLDHLHPFLQRQQLDYAIYIIHQAGNTKFNRAKLLNIGYLETLKEEKWDCFIFHDVDLVPENDFNLYLCDNEPKHLVVGRNATGYRLRYSGYFGGVTAMTRDQFAKVNGFSNNYWGWGGEDDDLRERVMLNKMKVVRPSPEIARYTMIFHKRDDGNEVNGERMRLLRQVARVWKTDGLNSCSYKLLSVQHNPLYINITVNISVSSQSP
ncbi:beta-1,4-galactosyltransferase 4 isoform X2 [Rhinatrema bivittatum]|uniref:beta-1,4-galactosyltransferase 4 isoform X2 n=1 Tax=Rhinatrema bivittatum TaxID=194408 RepID=UPI00112A19C6|nr:beta-1,4-galactosyltransferase 4 isoform X2 [Rhinatrema bivittatum]